MFVWRACVHLHVLQIDICIFLYVCVAIMAVTPEVAPTTAASPLSNQQQSENNSSSGDAKKSTDEGRAMIDSFHSLMRSLTAINRANAVKTDVDQVVTPALFHSKKAKLYQSTMRHLVHRDRDRPLTDIELLKLTCDDDDDDRMDLTKPLLRLRKNETSATHTRATSKHSRDPLSSEATPQLLGWPLLRRRAPQTEGEETTRSTRPSGPARRNLPRMEFLVVGGFEPEDASRKLSQSPAMTDDGFRLLRLPKKRSQVDRKYSRALKPNIDAEQTRKQAETARSELSTHSDTIRSRKPAPTNSDAERKRAPRAHAESDAGRLRRVHTQHDYTLGRLMRASAESGRVPGRSRGDSAEAESGHYVPSDLDRGRSLLRYAPADAFTQTSTNAGAQTEAPEANRTESKQVIHITTTAVQTSDSLTAQQIQSSLVCTQDQGVQVSGDFSQRTMATENVSRTDDAIATVDPEHVEDAASTSPKTRGASQIQDKSVLLESVSSDSVSSVDEGIYPTYGMRRVTGPLATTVGATSGNDHALATSDKVVVNSGAGNEENLDRNGGNRNVNDALAPISARMLQLQTQLDQLANHADNLEEELGDHHHRMHVVSEAHQSHILQWHKALHDADTENARTEVNSTLHRTLLAKTYNSSSSHPAAQDGEKSVAPPHWSHAKEEFDREQKKVFEIEI